MVPSLVALIYVRININYDGCRNRIHINCADRLLKLTTRRGRWAKPHVPILAAPSGLAGHGAVPEHPEAAGTAEYRQEGHFSRDQGHGTVCAHLESRSDGFQDHGSRVESDL